ncbi:MAG: hypothetical protein BMS9Abin36_2157 [Gammaproteobacteria bacterium]|nr:MAG: hypothetical protein BMS9Abin36_2157 [Gammaproteobacteria bacterium]
MWESLQIMERVTVKRKHDSLFWATPKVRKIQADTVLGNSYFSQGSLYAGRA